MRAPDALLSVAIPVGPAAHHAEWLGEAITSVEAQTARVNLHILRDGYSTRAHTVLPFRTPWYSGRLPVPDDPYTVASTPWANGVAAAFNNAVMSAPTPLVLMMGSDDTLEPGCCQALLDAYWATAERDRDRTYYSLTVRYMDDRPDKIQTLPCNAAMVSQAFWRAVGGFAPESGSGAPDAALLSCLMANGDRYGYRILRVREGEPLYNVRIHPAMDTGTRGPWQGVILETRDILTRAWRPRDG